MKAKNLPKQLIFVLAFFAAVMSQSAVQAQDSALSPPVLGVRYFLPVSKVPYLEVGTKRKVGKKFEPVKGIHVKVYFSEESAANLLGTAVTGKTGLGWVSLPPSFKPVWDSLTEFKFVAVSDSSSGIEPMSADVTVKKAILVIDTANADGTRSVTAQLREKKGNEWVAVGDVEMKLGIKRLLSNLSVGEAETYTSDSSGTASAEFKRDSLPGDEKGGLLLVAKVEDNDSYGNLEAQMPATWGKPVKAETHFWHRTLWSTGDRAPIWLLFIALSIIVGVWGTLFYLVRQIFKIKKMGSQHEKSIAAG